jgi:hypothetical protein
MVYGAFFVSILDIRASVQSVALTKPAADGQGRARLIE